MIHGATVEDDCLIGMGATVLNGAVIGAGSLVAAQALVPQGMRVPLARWSRVYPPRSSGS